MRFWQKPLDSSCYNIYKRIKCKYSIISNEKTARVKVFIKKQTQFVIGAHTMCANFKGITNMYSPDVLALSSGKIIKKQCPWSGLNSTVEE